MITHAVLFKLSDVDDAFEARRRISDLRGRIPAIRSLSTGVDAARNGSQWHVALISSHDDWDAFDSYKSHPAHVELLAWLDERVVERAAVDFES